MPQPAIQLYTLRNLDQPVATVIERVAAAGYEGIEFAHGVLTDRAPATVRDALDETGIQPIATHIELAELTADFEAILDFYRAIGCSTLVIPHLDRSWYLTARRIDQLVHRLTRLESRLADRGFSLVYHNVAHDFCGIDTSVLGRSLRFVSPTGSNGGRALTRPVGIAGDFLARVLGLEEKAAAFPETAFVRLADRIDPSAIEFELDVGGISLAGFDPVDVIEYLGARAPMIHLHDVGVPTPSPWATMESTPPGAGAVDLEAVIAAAERIGTEWLVFEHDDPDDPVAMMHRGAEILGIGGE